MRPVGNCRNESLSAGARREQAVISAAMALALVGAIILIARQALSI